MRCGLGSRNLARHVRVSQGTGLWRERDGYVCPVPLHAEHLPVPLQIRTPCPTSCRYLAMAYKETRPIACGTPVSNVGRSQAPSRV